MPQNPPEGKQRICPYLVYQDAPAAIEFLCRAFGFEERYRLEMKGLIGHAEVDYQDNVVMLASVWDGMGIATPSDLPAIHAMIVCYVDDVDAHYARAKREGATVQGEPEDQPYGDRTYRALDLEGHRWFFHQHVKDVSDEDIAKGMAARRDGD